MASPSLQWLDEERDDALSAPRVRIDCVRHGRQFVPERDVDDPTPYTCQMCEQEADTDARMDRDVVRVVTALAGSPIVDEGSAAQALLAALAPLEAGACVWEVRMALRRLTAPASLSALSSTHEVA